jgi:hypothetical protein
MPRARLIALVALGCLASETAEAYILPAHYILKLMADKRRRMAIRDLSIQLTTEIDDLDEPVEERLYMKNPERLRRIRQHGGDTELLVQIEGRAAKGTEGALSRIKGPPPDLLPALLMPLGNDTEEMTARLLKSLERLGVDTKVVTLGRFNDSIVYIIGGRHDDEDKAQLWVEKDTFLPIRLLAKKDGERVEQRWEEFGSASTGDWFPRVIETYVSGRRVEHSEVDKIDLNKKVPETLFELP